MTGPGGPIANTTADIRFYGGGISWYGGLQEGQIYGAAVLSGSTNVQAVATLTAFQSSFLEGGSSVIAVPLLRRVAGSLVLSGEGNLVAGSALRLVQGITTLEGASDLQSSLSFIDVVNGAASLAGSADVVGGPALLRDTLSATLTGAASLSTVASGVVRRQLGGLVLAGSAHLIGIPKLDDFVVRGTYLVVTQPGRSKTDRRLFAKESRFQ